MIYVFGYFTPAALAMYNDFLLFQANLHLQFMGYATLVLDPSQFSEASLSN